MPAENEKISHNPPLSPCKVRLDEIWLDLLPFERLTHEIDGRPLNYYDKKVGRYSRNFPHTINTKQCYRIRTVLSNPQHILLLA